MRIKRIQPILLALLIVGAVSCQKEVDYVDLGDDQSGPGNPSNKSITGDWKFVRMLMEMDIHDKTDDGMLNLETSMKGGFISFNEKGTLKIESNKMTGNGISYSVDTVFKMQLYNDGALEQEMEMPWKYDMPASNGASTFQRIGDDSLAIQSSIMDADMPVGNQPAQPTGMKISWSGDTLLLVTRANQFESSNAGGIKTETSYYFKQTVKLIKN